MKKLTPQAIELIKERLLYSASSGLFVWRKTYSGRAAAGKVAGSIDSQGYTVITVAGCSYHAHRMAWAIHNGKVPSGVIDHINGDRSDNRAANLRDVTSLVNSQNKRQATPRSKSGLLGAFPNKNKWKSEIKVGPKSYYLGNFDTPKEAHEAHVVAKRRLHAGNTL